MRRIVKRGIGDRMLTIWGLFILAEIDYERLNKRTVMANHDELWDQALAMYLGYV